VDGSRGGAGGRDPSEQRYLEIVEQQSGRDVLLRRQLSTLRSEERLDLQGEVSVQGQDDEASPSE
jgi:hypothetical protein